MISLAFDENFNNDVVRGLLRRNPALDAVRVWDAGFGGSDDPGSGGCGSGFRVFRVFSGRPQAPEPYRPRSATMRSIWTLG